MGRCKTGAGEGGKSKAEEDVERALCTVRAKMRIAGKAEASKQLRDVADARKKA